MILTNQPRLYFTSTLDSDGKEGMYKSDIMLFSNLKVGAKTGDVLNIHCPNSGKTYVLNTSDAKTWSQKINKVLSQVDLIPTLVPLETPFLNQL